MNNRRDFLKNSTVFALTAFFGAKLLTWGQSAYAAALSLVDMSKTKRKDPENEAAVGILSGMGYVEDADKAEKAKKLTRVEKDNPAGGKFPAKKQHCGNCMLLEDADQNTGKPGKCKLVQTALVHANGYCNTYSVSTKAKA